MKRLLLLGAALALSVSFAQAQTRSIQLNQDNRGPITYDMTTKAATFPGAVTTTGNATVSGNQAVTGNLTVTGTSLLTGNVTASGNIAAATGLISAAYNTTSGTPGTIRDIYGKISIGTGLTMSSGNIVGVRGEVNVPSGTTTSAAGAYLYGVQGKFIGGGTITDGNLCGVCAQIDASSGTYTAGVLSGAWIDMGATASASAISTKFGGASQLLRMTNTTGAETAFIFDIYANADVFMQLGGPAAATDYVLAAGTGANSCGLAGGMVAAKVIYITVSGVDYYIPLCSSNAN